MKPLFVLSISVFLAALTWAEEENAASEPAEKARYMVPNKLAQKDQEVRHYLTGLGREEELVSLQPGDADLEEIIGFYLPQRTRTPQGAVVILPSNGEHSLWPAVITPLRESLPDSGWSSLVVNLPDVPPTPTSRLLDSEPAAAEQNNANAPTNQQQQQIYRRIAAAINYLQAQGQLNLAIIAHGDSATWAALWLIDSGLGVDKERGVGLALIDPIDSPYAPQSLNRSLAPLKFPVLDLITPTNRSTFNTHRVRKGVMLNNKNAYYQQIQLNDINQHHYSTSGVSRRVQGWLKTEMAGEERRVKQSDDAL